VGPQEPPDWLASVILEGQSLPFAVTVSSRLRHRGPRWDGFPPRAAMTQATATGTAKVGPRARGTLPWMSDWPRKALARTGLHRSDLNPCDEGF
jgi:hypothetical protein